MYKYILVGNMRVRLINDISLEGLTNSIKYVPFVSEVISPLPCAYLFGRATHIWGRFLM